MSEAVPIETEEPRNATQLPEPKAIKILIALPDPERNLTGALLSLPKLHEEEGWSICGMVLRWGQIATRSSAIPSGPYCKEGRLDLNEILFRYRFKVHGKEFRLINDDSVEAVVEDPRGIVKA
jgi:hypothetical protein